MPHNSASGGPDGRGGACLLQPTSRLLPYMYTMGGVESAPPRGLRARRTFDS